MDGASRGRPDVAWLELGRELLRVAARPERSVRAQAPFSRQRASSL